MKILITGGTGFVGKKLVHELFMQGHDISVISRSRKKAQKTLDLPINFIQWRGGSETIAFDRESFDGVINLAGENIGKQPWTKNFRRKLRRSRVDYGQNLCEQLRRLPPVKFILSASAVGIYKNDPHETHDENGAEGEGFLADLVRDWERVWQEANCSDRLAFMRLGIVLGRQDGVLGRLQPVFNWGVGGRVGSGEQAMSWIHVDDLVRVFISACSDSRYAGVINCVAPRPVTNASFTRELARSLGRPAVIPVPAKPLRLVLGDMAQLVTEGQRVVPVKLLELGFQFEYESVGEALQHLVGPKKIGPAGEVLPCQCFEAAQFIDKPLSEVFEFFADPYNLEKITPPLLKFQIESVSPGSFGKGSLIAYKLKIRGISARWLTLIAEWQENSHFVDLQLKGPYKIWHHTHRFVEAPGGTMMYDRVFYQLPFGAIGQQLAGALVRRDVGKIFKHRREVISHLLK